MSDIDTVMRKLSELGKSGNAKAEIAAALARIRDERATLDRLMDERLERSDYEPNGARLVSPLREAFDIFRKANDFKPGDIVKWKPGMKNKRKPKYGEPMIVVAYEPENAQDPGLDADSPYFREPLNLQLGLLDTDGEFLVWHFDARRFEPFDQS